MLGASAAVLQKKNEETESKRKKEVNLVISHAPSADNSNLSADGDDSFISVEMDSAMPSPFSEVRPQRATVSFLFKKPKRQNMLLQFRGKNKKIDFSFLKKVKLMVTICIGYSVAHPWSH